MSVPKRGYKSLTISDELYGQLYQFAYLLSIFTGRNVSVPEAIKLAIETYDDDSFQLVKERLDV